MVTYDFIEGKPWNATTNPQGCYSFQGTENVRYIVTGFFFWPPMNEVVNTGADILAGRSFTLNLHRAVG